MFINRKLKELRKKERIAEQKQEILRDKKLFVLDNSLRESTVGQLRGHTIANKWKIYEQVKVAVTLFIVMKFEITNNSLRIWFNKSHCSCL